MNLPHRKAISSIAAIKATTATPTCFVYGTLMSPDVLQALLGRIPTMIPNAILQNHSRHPVIGRVYPGVIPNTPSSSSSSSLVGSSTSGSTCSSAVEGLLILDITPLEMKILDLFESEEDYKRSTVQVVIPSDDVPSYNFAHSGEQSCSGKLVIQTNTYIWLLGAETLDLSCDWDYRAFLQNHLEWFLDNTVRPFRRQIEQEMIILPEKEDRR